MVFIFQTIDIFYHIINLYCNQGYIWDPDVINNYVAAKLVYAISSC